MVEFISIFYHKRLPSGIKIVPVLIYLPAGLILALLRIFIGIQVIIASNILQKLSQIRLIILRGLCATLGLIVREEDTKFKDESAFVIVTNHVSAVDPIALHLTTGRASIGQIENVPFFLQQAFAINSNKSLRANELVAVQPEGFVTNGTALLKFATWPGELSEKFQPAVLKIWRPPLTQISPNTLGSSYLNDLLWFLITPITIITIKYLPVITKETDESAEDFMKKMENIIADALKIPVVEFTATDAIEYIKKTQCRKTQPDVDPLLVARVKEVLPDVPNDIIAMELAKTRDVDITITNLLDRPFSSPKPKASTRPKESPEKFPKSAHDRMQSFQQRKALLIETARRRYIEKHALNVINGS